MPGLIKIGKTTKPPDERLSGLQGTGVPTPFELEMSIEVSNSARGEKAAHHALKRYRSARNREFFRVPVATAMQEILSVVDDYKIHDAKSSHGIEKIERGIQEIKLEKERRIKAANEKKIRDELKQAEAYKKAQERRARELRMDIAKLQEKLHQLGPHPIKKKLPRIVMLLWFENWSTLRAAILYGTEKLAVILVGIPMLVGFLSILLIVFFPQTTTAIVFYWTMFVTVAEFLLTLLKAAFTMGPPIWWFAGLGLAYFIGAYLARQENEQNIAEYGEARKPFTQIDNKINDLKQELRECDRPYSPSDK